MSGNERATEGIVRRHFEQFPEHIRSIEEQTSDSPKIRKLLQNASKTGNGAGRPEFLIRFSNIPDLLLVVECKADRGMHESADRNQPAKYAVDGVLHYADYLVEGFDVLAIAISGTEEENLRISHFLRINKGLPKEDVFGSKLLTPEDYRTGYYQDSCKFKQDYDELQSFIRELNNELHRLRVNEEHRALLISSILFALEDSSFIERCKHQSKGKRIVQELKETVLDELKEEGIDDTKRRAIERQLLLVEDKPNLIKSDEKGTIPIKKLILDVEKQITSFIKNHTYRDVLGEMYVEFLRYVNRDKGFGIVLTPPHITELFSDLAQVNKSSIVYDNCAGTGGFLISAMKKMISDAGNEVSVVNNIKKKQIFGVEENEKVFSLVLSNMFIHNDGKSNIELGDCFDKKIVNTIKEKRPNIGFLNPPYKSSSTDIEEFQFLLNNLECIQPGGTCVAIVPMQCAIATKGKRLELKKDLLDKHTLQAVLSMPEQLFHNSKASVVTCIMVFKAHQSHNNKPVWMCLAKEDGYVVKAHIGRVERVNGEWDRIKGDWLEAFARREERPHFSAMKRLSPYNEWCAERYITKDYKDLSASDFMQSLRDYIGALFLQNRLSYVNVSDSNKNELSLQDRQWKYFRVDDVFNVSLGPYTDARNNGEGNIPYITRTALNNGVDKFIDHNSKYDTVYDGNCITIGAEGVVAFYQPDPFLKGNKINIIRHPLMNSLSAQFVLTVMNHMHVGIYNYGYALTMGRLKESQIPLPVQENNENQPDWAFMESFIEQLPYASNLT